MGFQYCHFSGSVKIFVVLCSACLCIKHMVQLIPEQKGCHWLSPRRMLKYQVALLEQEGVTLKTTSILNPALFLSAQQMEGTPEHDCLQTIKEVCSSRPNLGDSSLERPDWELFTNGSSVWDGKQLSGYEVTTEHEAVKSGTWLSDVLAQKAELIALAPALELSKGKQHLDWFKILFWNATHTWWRKSPFEVHWSKMGNSPLDLLESV